MNTHTQSVPRPELRAYEAALPELMARHQGQFVVIYGSQFAHFSDDYEEALEWAYEKYGLEPFFVKQVSEEENVAHYIRDFGPCLK
jgi:hypothetical protein